MNATAAKIAPCNEQIHTTHRDTLITEHLQLVNAIAVHVQKSLPVHVELDDLIHAGTMGLFDAATKYREDKEVAFSTYAKHRIKGAILDSLRQIDWASRDLRKRHKQMESVTRDLTDRLKRTPTQAEIAEAMGISCRRLQLLMIDFRNLGLMAIQMRCTERDDQPTQDAPCLPAHCPDAMFARSEMRERLASALKTLPARYQQVVTLYYERDCTMKEIGEILGVNESRVSQIHKCALERMQNVLCNNGIESSSAFLAA